MKSQPTMASAAGTAPPPRSWRWPFSHMRLALVRLDTHADAATTPAPMATGPVTRRTFRASRRSSRPRPCGMSWSSTTRSRGSSGLVELVAGQPVGDGGDRRRAHRHADEHVAGSGLARHHAAHERTRGERHQQRGDAHREARDGVVLRVVGRAGPDLLGARA